MSVNRLKTTYQRSLFLGFMLSSALIIAVGGWIHAEKEEMVIFPAEVIISAGESYPAGQPLTRSFETGYGKEPTVIPPDGPVSGYHIINEMDYSIRVGLSSAGFYLSGLPETGEWHTNLFGDNVQTAGHDLFDPAFDEYFNRPAGPPNLPGFPMSLDVDFKSVVSEHFRPLSIRLQSPINRPPFTRGLVDTVIVIVEVDRSGKIVALQTYYDTHPEMGFARCFKEALRNACFEPELRYGRKVGGAYPLFCIFNERRINTFVKSTDQVELLLGY